MRNQQDIERKLNQFPKQRLSEQSKEKMLGQILDGDDRSSPRQTNPKKRRNPIAVWAASLAAIALFCLLGGVYILDETSLTNSPAGEHVDIGSSEKTVPDVAKDTDDGQRHSVDETEKTDQTEPNPKNDEATESSDTQSKKQAVKPDIFDESDTIIKALANRDMKTLAKKVHPETGLLFSPYVYITDEPVVVDKKDVPSLLETDEQWTWGQYDGKGTPIKLTPKQYFNNFVDMTPYTNDPDNILVDELKKRGNTKNNIKDVFPDSKVVEYYDGGSEEYAGIDWNSVNLVYERDKDGAWRLAAIVRDVWTV